MVQFFTTGSTEILIGEPQSGNIFRDNDITGKIIGYAINVLQVKSGIKRVLKTHLPDEAGILALCRPCVVKLCRPPWLKSTPLHFQLSWK